MDPKVYERKLFTYTGKSAGGNCWKILRFATNSYFLQKEPFSMKNFPMENFHREIKLPQISSGKTV
jgi:hypothetical protein